MELSGPCGSLIGTRDVLIPLWEEALKKNLFWLSIPLIATMALAACADTASAPTQERPIPTDEPATETTDAPEPTDVPAESPVLPTVQDVDALIAVLESSGASVE